MNDSWKNRRVLVTGGTGFIGSFLVEELLQRGAKVRVPMRSQNYRALSSRRDEVEWLEGDLRDKDYCSKLLRGMDCVFHLASRRRTGDFHQERCSDVLMSNVEMSGALINAMRDLPRPIQTIFFSTANVPADLDVIKLAQEENTDGYVLGKALCEAMWFAASQQHGFPLLILRPVGAYGPRDTFAEDATLVPKFMTKARDGAKELEVWGDGSEELAFLYVRDLVNAVFTLLEADARGIQYVVPPQTVTTGLLAKTVQKTLNEAMKVRYDKSKKIKPRSIPRLPLHPSLKKFAWTPIEEGIYDTASWLNDPQKS